MPWIPLYLTQSDAGELLKRLNADEEIAFIRRESPNSLVATETLAAVTDGRLCLWHIPSGPLPWYRQKKRWFVSRTWLDEVPDPWRGWPEEMAAADGNPWFGNHAGIIWWNVATQSVTTPGAIGMSGFEWIGNRYAPLGFAAPDATNRWWRRLRAWIDRRCRKVPRFGPIAGSDAEIFTFPGAFAFLENGGARDENP